MVDESTNRNGTDFNTNCHRNRKIREHLNLKGEERGKERGKYLPKPGRDVSVDSIS